MPRHRGKWQDFLLAWKVLVTHMDDSRGRCSIVWHIDTKWFYALSVIILSENLQSQSSCKFTRI
jgi:hypothetical protein